MVFVVFAAVSACAHLALCVCVSSCDCNCRSFGPVKDQQTTKQQSNCSNSISHLSPSFLLFIPPFVILLYIPCSSVFVFLPPSPADLPSLTFCLCHLCQPLFSSSDPSLPFTSLTPTVLSIVCTCVCIHAQLTVFVLIFIFRSDVLTFMLSGFFLKHLDKEY